MKRALVIVLVAACDLTYSPSVGPLRLGQCDNAPSNPSNTVSFALDVHPLMTRTTGGGCSCHLGHPTSGLDLSSYASLRRGGINSGANVVISTQPCNSIIVQKLGLTPPFGSRMPFNGPPYWSDDERSLIHDWIAEGAQDN
jgi:hypothetical protein